MIKIYSWNVNGIRAVHNKGLFLPFIEKEQPDILCLQETKAAQHQSEVDLPDYEEFWNSADKKGYSGTAIFTKIKPLKIINGLPDNIIKKFGLIADGYGDPNSEGRVVAAEFNKFYLVTVYTPNAKDDLSRIPLRHEQWDPAFLAYCQELEKQKPVIFVATLMLRTQRTTSPTQSQISAKEASLAKNAKDSKISQGLDLLTHLECLQRATVTIAGGPTGLNRGNETLVGVLITF